mmetsp:Transcript_6708/g.17953  ORF Transcript_6708/g.17953 Transcript_6708/m.17953 type:complete len:105 (+) Transcript_6708:574-888(+)
MEAAVLSVKSLRPPKASQKRIAKARDQSFQALRAEETILCRLLHVKLAHMQLPVEKLGRREDRSGSSTWHGMLLNCRQTTSGHIDQSLAFFGVQGARGSLLRAF